MTVEPEELPLPTPREEKDEQRVETSASEPRSQRVSKLLEEIHELEILDREIKRNNDILTKRNKQLQNSILEMRGMYVLLKRRNLRYMKDNIRLYRMIRILRLQLKKSRSNPSSCFTLETLAEAAISL